MTITSPRSTTCVLGDARRGRANRRSTRRAGRCRAAFGLDVEAETRARLVGQQGHLRASSSATFVTWPTRPVGRHDRRVDMDAVVRARGDDDLLDEVGGRLEMTRAATPRKSFGKRALSRYESSSFRSAFSCRAVWSARPAGGVARPRCFSFAFWDFASRTPPNQPAASWNGCATRLAATSNGRRTVGAGALQRRGARPSLDSRK